MRVSLYICMYVRAFYVINQSIKYSFIDKKDNPPDTNEGGFYRWVRGCESYTN